MTLKLCPYAFEWILNFEPIYHDMSRLMGKPTICIRRKQRRRSASRLKLISAIVFATRIVLFLLYLNRKFQASSSFLCWYRSVCVRPVRKPHCWFSHEVAHMYCMSSGLCGVFSYNITDDLTRPDGREVSVSDETYMMANLDVFRPKPFLKAWR